MLKKRPDIFRIAIPESTQERLYNAAGDLMTQLSNLCQWRLKAGDGDGVESPPILSMIADKIEAIIRGAGETEFTRVKLEGYRYFTTRAPESYDGFSAMTVVIGPLEQRTVAVHERDVKWQLARYGSGLFGHEEVVSD